MAFPSSPDDATDLSPDDARELARLVRMLLNRLAGSSARDRSSKPGGAELVAKARRLLLERERRLAHFSPVMFGEPGWEMLLVLYVSEATETEQTIGTLVGSIGAPQTTALRWIDYLEKERLISRQRHELDRRAVVIAITEKGREKLDRYFSTSTDELQDDLDGS